MSSSLCGYVFFVVSVCMYLQVFISCDLMVVGFRGKVKGRRTVKVHAGTLSVSLACCLFSGLS